MSQPAPIREWCPACRCMRRVEGTGTTIIYACSVCHEHTKELPEHDPRRLIHEPQQPRAILPAVFFATRGWQL